MQSMERKDSSGNPLILLCPDPEIQRVLGRDIPGICALNRIVFRGEPYRWSDLYIEDYFKYKRQGIAMIKRERAVVGFVFASLHGISSFNYGEIDLLAVDPRFRGQGLGSRLLAHGIRFLQRQGTSLIALHTRVTNDAMRRRAETLGFKVTQTLPHFYGKHDDAAAFEMQYMVDNSPEENYNFENE